MNAGNERLGDDQLRGIAMARFHHDEAGVTPEETEAALRSVRALIDTGETTTGWSAVRPVSGSTRPAPWLLAGVAAAVLALVIGGLVVLTDRNGDNGLGPVAEPDPTVLGTTPATPDPGRAPTTTAPSPSPSTTTVTPPPRPGQAGDVLAIADNCASEFNCTQLANTEDGRLVAYDPTDETLRVYDAAGLQVQSEVPLATPLAEQYPFLVHIGPDDVAYFVIDTPNFDDPSNDLIAIPLEGPRAGAEVMRYTGLDGSGDSTLIAQQAGLMSVGCCGPSEPRPTPDAPLYHYVDDDGTRIESSAPRFRLDLGEVGNNVVRINSDGTQTFFNLPTVFQLPRDMPRLVATDDGGALGLDYVQLGSGGYSFVVRFRTDWTLATIDNADVYVLEPDVDGSPAFGPALLERTGTVVVRDDADGFVRRTLDQIGTPGWPGRPEIGVESGTVEVPGLNDYIAANQPVWAAEPDLLALQLRQEVDANESVATDFDASTQTLTITTSGFLDDSTAASRITVQTERADDGLLRVVSASYGWQCQPGRGHQNFSTEPCV